MTSNARQPDSTSTFRPVAPALAGLVCVLVLAGCATTSPNRPMPHPRPGAEVAELRIRLAPEAGGRIVRVPLERYVQGVVMAEVWMPGIDERTAGAMLELQSLVVRTYALSSLGRHRKEGFDLCSTTHCQIYREPSRRHRLYEAAGEAVRRTAGRYIVDRDSGVPIQSLFHANCGGHTSSADAVWGGPPEPHLQPVEDGSFCLASPNATWRYEIDRKRLEAALNAHRPTRSGGTLRDIRVVERDAAGRAETLQIRGDARVLVRGEDLRAAMNRAFGPRALRSTRFEIRQSRAGFVFEGHGFGHGVGLCQAGALARLRAGATPEQIVRHYYADARTSRISRGRMAN